jgi:LemA protein
VKTGLVVLGVVALAVILALGWFVSVGNGLVARELAVREAWAQVQNVYQRRADLVPNLVEIVKGFAAQERAVLEEVTRARASVAGIQVTPEVLRDPEALRKFQEAQAQLGGALGRLLAVVERYPDLKSNQNFLALQSQLEGTENRIAVERRRYNEAVREYNTAVNRFPGSLVASLRGFSARRYFEASLGADAPPPIKF